MTTGPQAGDAAAGMASKNSRSAQRTGPIGYVTCGISNGLVVKLPVAADPAGVPDLATPGTSRAPGQTKLTIAMADYLAGIAWELEVPINGDEAEFAAHVLGAISRALTPEDRVALSKGPIAPTRAMYEAGLQALHRFDAGQSERSEDLVDQIIGIYCRHAVTPA